MESPGPHPDAESFAPSEVEEVLRENATAVRIVFDAGSRAHPSVPLAYGTFARRLVEIVHRRPLGDTADTGPGQFLRRLARVAGEDIFLAIACEERVPGAWEAFLAAHARSLREAAERHRAPGTDSEEIAEGLLGDLFAPPASGDARTRIGTYDGTGPLGAWLLAVLRNRFLDAKRSNDGEARRRAARAADTPDASLEDDPATRVLGDEDRFRLEETLQRAWGGLTPAEQLALTLKFRDGRAQVEIAPLLGVGTPRVSRIVASGLEKLRRHLGDALPGDGGRDVRGPWSGGAPGGSAAAGPGPERSPALAGEPDGKE